MSRAVPVLSVFVVCSLAAVIPQHKPRSVSPRVVHADALEVHQFGNLREMVVESTAVVVGRVDQVRSGRTQGASHDAIGFKEYVLHVEDVLKGSVEGDSLLLEEEAWSDTGAALIVNNVAPTQRGDRGIYFISTKETRPYYALVNSQGRYLEVGGKLRGSNHEDRLVQELQRMSPAELARAVRDS